MSKNLVTVNIYHGGEFQTVNGDLQYVNGTNTKFKRFDADYLSLYQIEDAVNSLGYNAGQCKLWYKYPSEDAADRKPLWKEVDNNIRRMVNAAMHFKEVDVFVEHGSPEGCHSEGSYPDSYEDEEFGCDVDSFGDSDEESDAHWSATGSRNDEDQQNYGKDGNDELVLDDAAGLDEPFENEIIGDLVDVDILSEGSNNNAYAEDDGSRISVGSYEENYGDDRFPETPISTDEEWDNFGKTNHFRQQRINDQASDSHLSFLQDFGSRMEFKARLVKYALSTGYDIMLKRSCSKNMEAIFSLKPCGWWVYYSLEARSQRWMIKVYQEEHTCNQSRRTKILRIPEIAQLFLERIRRKPAFKATEMRDELKREYNITVSKNMCSKARKKALEIVRGDYSSQFAKLWEYAYEMTRSNPGTSIDLQISSNMEFSRLYICFASLKIAWKQFCRPVLGLDGCFLKWTLKGELLAAVGKDANNKMYPIAWAVVPVEDAQNWAWFIRKLKVDLDLNDGEGFTIISDKQKGLLKVVHQELPKIEHRMCARHIYANLKKRHKEKKLKPLFWTVARSYTTRAYEDAISAVKTLSLDAYQAVLGSDPSTWCRAFFKISSHCLDEHNNMSESFNSTIKEARTKPIIHMLEDIRRQGMERIFKRFKASMKEKNMFTPVAQEHIEQARKDSKNCVMFKCSEGQFEIDDCGSSYKLSLSGRSCSCREWDLTGLPCRHAICAITGSRLDVANYVSHYYLMKTWQGIYQHTMKAANGEKLWQKLGIPPIQAPASRKMPGRPKKRDRIQDPHESPTKKGRVTRHGRVIRCSICGKPGHNKATCTTKQHYTLNTKSLNQGSKGKRCHSKQADENPGISTQAAKTKRVRSHPKNK